MKIKVLFPHKLKSKPIGELVERYQRFCGRLTRVELVITPFADRTGRALPALLDLARTSDSVYLSERADPVDSFWFKEALERSGTNGKSLLFIVGGADGVPSELEGACHRAVSLTRLTLPHEMALLVLFEQFWRATSMIRGHPYHK